MKVNERVHLLEIEFHISLPSGEQVPRFVNVVLIFDETITLIDSGVKGCEEIIFSYIKEQKRDPSEISHLLLSHAHPDHIGAAKNIQRESGCLVLAYHKAAPWIEDINTQVEERPVPGFYNLVDESVSVDVYLNNGDYISPSESVTIETVYCPGHSKGSVSFDLKEDKILFTGDCLIVKNDLPVYDNFVELLITKEKIKRYIKTHRILTSVTKPLQGQELEQMICEGDMYLIKLDRAVHEYYSEDESRPLSSCRKVIEALGLPELFINPITDRAFYSHLNIRVGAPV